MSATLPRCQILPLPDQQVSFQIDRVERTRWHFGTSSPRPFFYPLRGPGGASLTRMGHPGAANHDHHRSVWFGHHQVLGLDFWSGHTMAIVRQSSWLVYEDGDEEAVMAVRLGWHDGHDPAPLMEQDLIATVRPGESSDWYLELQAVFRPKSATLELGQTNFGMLAVRVAKSISAHFGGGQICDSEGRVDEPAIFGQRARWMDYSGPEATVASRVAGITYFDHPSNPDHPAAWHVREDGWMGASICRTQPVVLTTSTPLSLRYLLHVHAGAHDRNRAEKIFAGFDQSRPVEIVRATQKHRQFEIRRSPS